MKVKKFKKLHKDLNLDCNILNIWRVNNLYKSTQDSKSKHILFRYSNCLYV